MKITHKNILRVYQILEDSAEIYYLVEYCEGGSLWDAMNYIKGRRFNEK
jgi:serine/threonine protein kinase